VGTSGRKIDCSPKLACTKTRLYLKNNQSKRGWGTWLKPSKQEALSSNPKKEKELRLFLHPCCRPGPRLSWALALKIWH
jgi:hypothetical protein